MNDNRTLTPEADDRARFVVLFHQFPPGHRRDDHWDLMLEWDGELITWALSEMPTPGKPIPASTLPRHRKFYLDYEGPVSGDRGSVTRVMEGFFSWIPDSTSRSSAILEFNKKTRWQVEFVDNDASQMAIFKQLGPIN